MARLIYAALSSLDGFIEDEEGRFDWAEPSDEVHQFVNDLERAAGTYLYGRRMYETMAAWETDQAAQSPVTRDYAAIWQAAEKIVFSTTLLEVSTRRTRLERAFEPVAVRDLKAARDQDLLIGGPNLAARAFAADLVDECHLFLAPVVVGGGKRCFPSRRLPLQLLEQRCFDNGMVYVRYRTRPSA